MLRYVPTSSTRLRAADSAHLEVCRRLLRLVVERRCTNCRWYKTVRRCTRCVVMGGASAPLHARCRRRRASLRADVVEATRRGGALVEASRRLLGLAVELRLTNDGLSSFSRECGVDTARTRRAARTENTRLHPHSTTKAVHFCFHSKIEAPMCVFARV